MYNKYVYDSIDILSYSIHIQFLSQNCFPLYLIQYQMIIIIIKRLERIKLNNADDNGNGNDTTTTMTQVEVEDKDGYYRQDKGDDKYVYVSIGILLYSIHIQFFSQNQFLLLLSLIQIQIIKTRMTPEEK